MRAVIDRIVDGTHAVLLVGEEETELVMPVNNLPAGAREGTWLSLRQDPATGAWSCPDLGEDDARQEAAMRDRISDKMARLRRRGRRSAPPEPEEDPPDPSPGGSV